MCWAIALHIMWFHPGTISVTRGATVQGWANWNSAWSCVHDVMSRGALSPQLTSCFATHQHVHLRMKDSLHAQRNIIQRYKQHLTSYGKQWGEISTASVDETIEVDIEEVWQWGSIWTTTIESNHLLRGVGGGMPDEVKHHDKGGGNTCKNHQIKTPILQNYNSCPRRTGFGNRTMIE